METIKLTEKNLNQTLNKALQILKSGGIIVYPTDTVYGLGALSGNQKAIKKIHQFKGTNQEKPMSVIVPSLDYILKRIDNLSKEQKNFILERLPGPYTFVLKIKSEFQKEFLGLIKNGKQGFRIPKNNFCLKLAKKLGQCYITTSANLTNQPPTYSHKGFKKQLMKQKLKFWPDLFIDAGELSKNQPSKIIDLSVYPYKILR